VSVELDRPRVAVETLNYGDYLTDGEHLVLVLAQSGRGVHVENALTGGTLVLTHHTIETSWRLVRRRQQGDADGLA